jgi:hypothetical protein
MARWLCLEDSSQQIHMQMVPLVLEKMDNGGDE